MTIIKSYIVFNGATSQGGGSGTVTSFSSGDLSPLFTTSVATATTTPALTFTLTNQNANLVFAGPTNGEAAAPSFRSLVAADFPALPYWETSGTSTLVGATIIDCDANDLTITSSEGADITQYLHTPTAVQINAQNTATDHLATGIIITPSSWSIAVLNNTSGAGSSIVGTIDSTSSIVISSTNAAFDGLKYAGNYTANFVTRSLIDKGYADAAYWKVTGTTTLTADNTIAMATFNVGFLNGNILSGPTGATITASTRLDVRGISGGTIQRWASDANTVRGGFTNDGYFFLGTAAITSATEPLQIGSTTVGMFTVARFANKSGGSSTTAARFIFENDQTSANGLGQIIRGSSAYNLLAGANSFNFGTDQAHPIGFFTNNQLRYSVSSTGMHTWTNNATSGTNTDFTFTQNVRTSGVPTLMVITGGAHTGLTAGSSITDLNFNLARTIQWASNTTVTNYRGQYLQAPTLAFASATGTVTTAATLSISGAPIVGTNAAITNAYALNVEAGVSNFGGNIRLTQTVTSEALTSDRSVTIVINGTTYKLLAKV